MYTYVKWLSTKRIWANGIEMKIKCGMHSITIAFVRYIGMHRSLCFFAC